MLSADGEAIERYCLEGRARSRALSYPRSRFVRFERAKDADLARD